MRPLLFPLLVILAACGDARQPEVKRSAAEIRRDNADRLAGTSITAPRTYRDNGNEIKVFEVPTAAGRSYVETQRCFVWRDLELRTAAISCPDGSGDTQVEHSR